MKLLVAVLLVSYASADVSHIVGRTGEAAAEILSQDQDIGLEGQYRWGYETANGISAREQGAPKIVPGEENPAEQVEGSVRYTAPGGEVIETSYQADENGYRAQGPHLPVGPPVPEPILRALEYIRTHPPKEIIQN